MRRLLLDRGADVASGDNLALCYAIRKENHNLASLSLERGTHVPVAKPSHQHTLEYAIRTRDLVMARKLLPVMFPRLPNMV